MANADYVTQGSGLLCPSAELQDAIGPLDTSISLVNLDETGDDSLTANMAALIGDEIVRVTVSGNTATIARGCCDTIPAAHPAGEVIFFFGNSLGSDNIEYAATETIGVKVLPQTSTSGTLAVSSSPPNELTFNWRFARPYPPGNVLANGDPWFNPVVIGGLNDGLALTWAHRDRVVQSDQLIDHTEGDIGPELGVTYEIRVYDDTEALVATYDAITDNFWNYPLAQAMTDLSVASGATATGSLVLTAVRDGLSSWQSYTVEFEVQAFILIDVDLARGRALGLVAEIS